MSDLVIEAENLGKSYWIGHQKEPYVAFRDYLASGVRSLGRRLLKPFEKRESGRTLEEFWALRDVSFQVKRGEVLGMIGRNGAGKSTLLKLLSQITAPTKGRFTVDGRMASLLEVGTGFHPELTGRENIFLNGAILGMTRKEIRSKFDEIVEFAGVEKFLDTPVKRYSSGMYLRLAFAVAAHLSVDILLVDEVLAVGDAAFQKKCLGAMADIAKSGRTVVFVSHNMAAVSKLCSHAIVLDKGKVVFSGDKDQGIRFYTDLTSTDRSSEDVSHRQDRKGNGELRIQQVGLYHSERKEYVRQIGCHEPLVFRIRYKANVDEFIGRFVMGIYDPMNVCALFLDTLVVDNLPQVFPMEGEIEVSLSGEYALVPGDYTVGVAGTVNGDMADHIENAISFQVEPGVFFPSGKFPSGRCIGYVKHQWTLKKTGEHSS